MPAFFERVSDSLSQFDTSLGAFSQMVDGQPAEPPRFPQKDLDRLAELLGRARKASAQLARSFDLIQRTGLDVVDMHQRIRNESTGLASALKGLGETVERQHFVRERFSGALVELDERAQLLAAAIFPSAVEGLDAVNLKLFEFEPQQWKRYTDLLARIVQQGKLTTDQEGRIQVIADGIRDGFTQVNAVLNELAEGHLHEGDEIRARVDAARKTLKSSLQEARRRMTKAHDMFRPMLDASGRIAEQVDKLLAALQIPCFPRHDKLGVLGACIDAAVYEHAGGAQRFALLNIAARMHATIVAGQPLLSPAYDIRITRLFPDRMYLDASRTLIDAVQQDPAFDIAPAALHRFNDGSFKQRTHRKGNLQLSFAARADGRVDIDADVDLYRSAVPHLFGEVLVNHLTGSVTNQFAVHGILDAQGVPPLGGFEVLTSV